ncbi:MAG: ABC transporter permease [Chloroflexota bacterium]
MARLLVRRLLFMILTLWVISVTIFAVTEVLPGDVAQAVLGQQATAENLAAIREQLGLNRSPVERYVDWITSAVRGDLGESLRMGIPVAPILMERLGNSLALAGLAFVMGVPLAILLGVVAGIFRNRWPDTTISVSMLVAVSLPEFVTGVLLILIFANWLRWLPPSSLIAPGTNPLEALEFLILPAMTLTLVMLAHTARMTRTSMADVLRTNYVRTGVLKGLPWGTVILKHALRNALLPTITVVAMNVGWLIGGLIIVENVFSYPGVGRLLLEAVNFRDVPVLQAVTLVTAAVYSLANLMADLLYARLNPRVRLS